MRTPDRWDHHGSNASRAVARRNAMARLVAVLVVMAVGALMAAGCNRRTGAQDPASPQLENAASEAAPRVPFEVRRESSDLTFFWFDPHGTAHAVSRVDDVPAAARETVRVDPARPELRAPGWVYVADLRNAGTDGRFTVRAVASEEFANQLAAVNGLAAAMAAPPAPPPGTPAGQGTAGAQPGTPSVLQPAPPPGAQPQVVLYGAEWCGACHQAAAWLRSQNIPFVEHDIEREPEAARQMMARAQQQGVPTGSIPIIDIRGRLMVGFNPEAIQQALRGG